MHALRSMWLGAVAIIALQLSLSFAQIGPYPELRPDLERYQDARRCGRKNEDYYLVYRNYLFDSNYGGTSKCVKFHAIEVFGDTQTSAKYSWSAPGYGRQYLHGRQHLASSPGYSIRNLHTITSHHVPGVWRHHTIYKNCHSCYIARHHYARGGYGCSLWRPASVIAQNRIDYCDFIFDALCGSSPKYYIYDPACERTPNVFVTNTAPWDE
ncbi:hypothetical protein MRX96_033763 [Rhipicephalus microplus]